MRSEASENPFSIAARVNPEKITSIAARMDAEIPNATPTQRADWLLGFEKSFPMNFKNQFYRGDLFKLTAAELLALANGATFIPSLHLKNRR
jgi:hypothetical protein